MGRFQCDQFFTIVMLVMVITSTGVRARTINITADEVHEITAHPDENVVLQLYHYPQYTSFIVCEVHTREEILGLSLTETFLPESFVSGSDVGVVTQLTDPQQSPVTWYLRTNGTKYASSFTVLVLAQTYDEDHPVPGGCNIEFPLATDPNLHTSYAHHSLLVSFQYGHQGPLPSSPCDPQKRLTYEVYQYYLHGNGNHSYESAVRDMLLVKGIRDEARMLREFGPSDKTLQRFSAYMGRGVAYNVIVTDSLTKKSTPYVAVVDYGCPHGAKHCPREIAANKYGMLFVVAIGLLGLLMSFVGHRFFKTELFVFGFLGFLLIAFIMLLRFSSLSEQACLAIATVVGLVGGALCLTFWYFRGIPILSVLFVGLVSGYLVSCIVFNLTPLKDMVWWQQPITYGLSFACGVITIPVLLLAFTRTLNILSCSVVGGYLAVITVDTFLHGNLSQVVLISIRKATWAGYMDAIITYPYRLSDLILVIAWALIAVCGAAYQFIRERNRAPFPPCPWQIRQLNRQHATWTSDPFVGGAESTNRGLFDSESDERSSLLANRH